VEGLRKVTVLILTAGVLALVPSVPFAAASGSSVKVVAAFYPVAYAAARVGGNRADVTNLTPAGAEPHDLELTPKQIDEILDAKVVFTMGRRFQPAVEKAAAARDGLTIAILDHLAIHPGSKKVDEGNPDALDPHVWLDPVLMQGIVREVQRALTRTDPGGRVVYERNARAFIAELRALDTRYATGLARCARHLIVTSHEAFGYLAHRYGLQQKGVAGLSPDAEPDAKRIAQLADLVQKDRVTVVFTETLVSPRIADTLAREAGVRTETLNPLEGLTDAEVSHHENYTTVMDDNLAKLRKGLACE
jgi:zinc transport system substrate-binding protein